MLRKDFLSKCMAVVGIAALFGLTAVANAQTKSFPTSKRFTVSPVQVTSTYSVVPQISQNSSYNPRLAAENEQAQFIPREKPNVLKAGALMSTSRGLLGAKFPGPTDDGWYPADNQMAVGPNHIVCMINASIAFYDKSGVKLFQQEFAGANGFFSGTAENSFVYDPKCFYDPISKRFFVLADDGSAVPNNQVVAVSDDSNPNGTWYKYRIKSDFNGSWLDYPGFGFNKDAIVITGNLFDGNGTGIEVIVVQKASLLTGGTAQVSVMNDPTSFTMQPARTTDVNVDKVFGIATGGGNAVRFFAVTNLLGTPVLKEVDVPVPAYAFPPVAVSGNTTLDTLGGRQLTAQYRNGQLVAAHNIGVNSRAAVRWYDINVNNWPTSGTPSLKQSGNITQANTDFHMPAININTFEDISIFYTRSSSSIIEDLCFSARVKGDPLGQMGQPVKLFGAAQGGYGGRWGDYFVNEIDPVDDYTFWGFGMAINGNSFGSQVLKWTVTTGGSSSGVPVGADSISPFVGNYLIGDTTSIGAADGISYQIASSFISQFGQAAGAEVDFTVPAGTQNVTVNFATNSGGIAGGTNMVWAYNVNTGKFDLIGSTPMAATGNAQKFMTLRTADVPKYVGPGGLLRLEIRGHIPIKPFSSTMPPPFIYNMDLVQLLVR